MSNEAKQYQVIISERAGEIPLHDEPVIMIKHEINPNKRRILSP